MENADIKRFALALAKADTEKEVITALEKAEYWHDKSAWFPYGGESMNYSTIGNQQSSPDNALVEKLINSVDAVLMRECLKQKLEPGGNEAPQDIPSAQKKFFDIYDGKLSSLDEKQRAKLSENILLVATGSTHTPSFSIIDKGEGQSPKRLPETILSLTKSNKIKIPFVQGKFGMGGSGVLRFCSAQNSILLVISKRNHEIRSGVDEKMFGSDETRDMWGVTVARREDPKGGEKSSYYTYLKPGGEILSFGADELPLLPGGYPKALGEPLKSGTFIKLYEYDIGTSLRALIVFRLYFRLALLMPDVALPIKIVERRKYKGLSDNSTTLAGLSVRLDEDKSENLEPEFQGGVTGKMSVENQNLDYSIYVFKEGKKENYAKNEGVVFSVNGQTHGFLPKAFFTRKAVGMSYLADSILLMIDCSKISRRKQEELFMPSRDRLTNKAIRHSIEEKLEDIVKNHAGLRELQNRRRQEALKNKLEDSKPLVDALQDIIKKNPNLATLFSPGVKITDPFKMDSSATRREFDGKEFPSYFNLVKEYTSDKPKHCGYKRICRIHYRTDVENNYFKRDKDPGELIVKIEGKAVDYSLSLWNGSATLTINIPDYAQIGDILHFETEVNDVTQVEPFKSKFCVLIQPSGKSGPPGNGESDPPDDSEKGKDKKKPSSLDVPNLVKIKQDDWEQDKFKEFNFDKFSALKVKATAEGNAYDFFVNVDNIHLKTEIKRNSQTDPAVLEARYCYGMVLLGVSILKFEERNSNKQENKSGDGSDENQPSVYERISQLTEAVSQTLLPMIAVLGSSDFEE